MQETSNISVTTNFRVYVEYEKTNRHETKIFKVHADVSKRKKYILICRLSLNSKNEVTYQAENTDMICDLLKGEILKKYDSSALLKLIEN